ncbi:putative P450 monooxygenase [Eremomyces bilateralis CBS 781.70]|uniref:P450 monooxygenase n=1 Tax=Eremomyces bilateralis CBS 781.70 TaxID=1392243 RepID=A0A6G1G2B2_9PEZI|nr:putative P450 monooxygenase [Eremomyces bilateralis CBS 781.70]KAF1812194.1 putative P450 monooxygenase [Eremomyces bilateralis CBS 781.70]
MHFFTFIFIVAAFLLTLKSIKQYVGLRRFRGPRGAGWSRLWMLRVLTSGRMHKYFGEVNEEYGSTARIAPSTLLTKDVSLIRRMSAVRSPYTRSKVYEALRLHPERDNIVSYRDEAIHGQLRTKMSPGYSGKDNPNLEMEIEEQILNLIALIERSYTSDSERYNPVDLARIMTFFTLDVISGIAFGRPFGFLTDNSDPFGYLQNLRMMLPAIMFFSVYPELLGILRLPAVQYFFPKASDATGVGKVMGWAKESVAARFGPNKIEQKDMLGSFLAHGLTQEELESETLTQITAGSDSTSTALRLALMHIFTHQGPCSKLLEELTNGLKDGKISRPIIRDSEARELPYLQACIKESLRLYPPVTGMLSKNVPPEGDTIDGIFVPGGTSIAWNSWGMCHEKSLYGDDPYVFRPERWLLHDKASPDDEARLQAMNDTVWMVFGYGRFGCLGRPVAMMELNKTIAEFVLRFDCRAGGGLEKMWDEESFGFFLHRNMWMRIEKRDDKLVWGKDKFHAQVE